MKKRIISFFTALSMTLMLFAGMPTGVSAEDFHQHKMCADSGHANCSHLPQKYDPFPTGDDSLNTITSDKNYYLAGDVDLSDTQIYINNATVNLCLNGCTLKIKGITVSDNGVLNVCDCKTGGCFTRDPKYTYGVLETRTGGKLNIYNGKISVERGIAIHCGSTDEDGSSVTKIYGGEISGGEIMVENGDTLSIYGGTIKNEAEDCNGISVLQDALVNINGGTIIGGKYGIAANYSGSTVNISGGSVEGIDNAALYIQNGVVCNITGGTVTSTNHSAVYTLDGGTANINGGNLTSTSYPTVWIANEGIANISGGSISNSGYKSYIWNSGTMAISGGVFSANMSKGYIRNYGNFSLQGSPTLTNTYIWLSSDDNITIFGALKNNDKYTVYVDSSLPRTFTSGWDTHMTDKNVSEYFNSPYDGAKIVYRDNEAVMAYYYRITYDANGGSCMVASAEANASDKLADLAVPTRDGYIFAGWFTEKTGGEQVTTDTVFTDDTTIYAHWTCNDHIWGDTYEKDENQHWKICTRCNSESEKTNHTWNGGEETTPPTETAEGVMTYKCTVCNAEKREKIDKLPHTHTYSDDWTSDEDGHWHAATCGHDVKSGEAEHDFGAPTVTPSTCTQHGSEEYICRTCGYKKTVTLDLAEHSFDGEWQKDENNHWKVCTVCRTEKSEVTPHSWNDGEISEQPTENEEGVMLYTCTVCQAAKTEPIAPLDHTHDWSGEWSKDDTYHWHDCLKNCGEKKDNAVHEWDGGTVTKQPTAEDEGEKTFECTVCGQTRTETIPAAGEPSGSGNISHEVQPGNNAPDTELKTPLEELIEAVLTPEEQEEVENGVDIKIILTVEDGTELVSDEDKEKIEETINGLTDYKLGQYLDVNLLKIIGEEQTKISETKAPIKITFGIPENLLGSGRKYSVIRVHDGEAAVLSDLDEDDDTVTIETDRFSTYALAFREKEADNTEPPVSEPSYGGDSGFHVPDENRPTDSGTPSETEPAVSDTSSFTGEGEQTDAAPVTVPSESQPADGENTSPEIAEPLPDNDNGLAGGYPSNDTSASDSGKENNPTTGTAISLVPFTAVLAVLTAAAKRKNK